MQPSTDTSDLTLAEGEVMLPPEILAAIDDHTLRRLDIIESEQRRRYRLIMAAEEDPKLQALHIQACKRSFIYFFNNWLWTFDERNAAGILPVNLPFVLRPQQEAFLDWLHRRIENKQNGAVKKSRAEGATYLTAGYALWRFLFTPGFHTTFGSRALEFADNLGNMNAILPKFRYMLYRLPIWFYPDGYSQQRHDNFKRIRNPATGAVITAEGGSDMGHGGRSSLFVLDEHARIQHAQQVDGGVSQNADTVLYVSTPKGVGNLFYRKVHEGRMPVFEFHWTTNPNKNYTITWTNPLNGQEEEVHPWYYKKSVDLDPIVLAEQIDIDFSASLEGVFIVGAWVRAAVGLKLQAKGHNWTSLDVGEGTSEHCFGHRIGPVCDEIKGWRTIDPLDSFHYTQRRTRALRATFLRYDRVGPGSTLSGTYERWKVADAERVEAGTMLPEAVRVPFDYEGYNGGAACSEITYGDDVEVPASGRFKNRRAEDMWSLRLRFYRTWQHVNNVARHHEATLISIPNDPTLIAQLSTILYFTDEAGLIRAESKAQMSSRGVASPDRAEMLYMLFSSWEKPSAQFFF